MIFLLAVRIVGAVALAFAFALALIGMSGVALDASGKLPSPLVPPAYALLLVGIVGATIAASLLH